MVVERLDVAVAPPSLRHSALATTYRKERANLLMGCLYKRRSMKQKKAPGTSSPYRNVTYASLLEWPRLRQLQCRDQRPQQEPGWRRRFSSSRPTKFARIGPHPYSTDNAPVVLFCASVRVQVSSHGAAISGPRISPFVVPLYLLLSLYWMLSPSSLDTT